MRLVAQYCSAPSFCVGRADSKKDREGDDETTGLRDHETTRPRDNETAEKPSHSQAFSGILRHSQAFSAVRGNLV